MIELTPKELQILEQRAMDRINDSLVNKTDETGLFDAINRAAIIAAITTICEYEQMKAEM